MKKQLFSILATAAIVLGLGLSSCVKEDPTTSIVGSTMKKATIEGSIFVVSDLTATPQKLAALPKLDIFAYIPLNQLNSLASGGNHIVKATYDPATGKYKVVVPATDNSVRVNFVVHEVEGKRTTATGVKDGVWAFNVAPVTVFAGEYFVNTNYTVGIFSPITVVGDNY